LCVVRLVLLRFPFFFFFFWGTKHIYFSFSPCCTRGCGFLWGDALSEVEGPINPTLKLTVPTIRSFSYTIE